MFWNHRRKAGGKINSHRNEIKTRCLEKQGKQAGRSQSYKKITLVSSVEILLSWKGGKF